ncbi:MAG: 30S ribosomal protein S6e [Methanobacteriota archaeon]
MAEFRAVISDPKTGMTYQKVVGGNLANSLVGKKIGDKIDGIFVEMPGYKLQISGGSDKDGVPMRSDLPGPRRKMILTAESTGFHPERKGTRKRKNFRGNTVSPDTIQLNMKIIQYGPRAVKEIFPPKAAEGEAK